MATTCFVCCEDTEYWTLPPCNHTHICWKCCLKLVDGSIFSCPFCKNKPQAKSQLLFVTTEQMLQKEFQTIMQHNPYRSNKNTYYFYSNKKVAEYIEAETSYHCILCGQVHQTMNLLKKHLYGHRVQFCDVCLQNRKCMIPQQKLYTDYQLQIHLKQGETSATGEIALYHPHCEFCARRFYDLQAFKIHLKMSAHLKCQICDLNCPKLKHVYYKNFQELQRHHRKSHFVCDVGQCIIRKLQNVFASQTLLEQHKRRFHRKYRGDKNEKVDNIILGFNKKQEDDILQFDGIGRDLSHQFTVFQLQGPVQKQLHNDQLIDLRQFYPQIVKANHNPKIQEIINRTLQLQDRKQLNFAHLPLYKPLEMSSLSRDQCYRLIRKVCSPKEADAIFELFFAKKNDFKSVQEYIQAIQRKMRSYTPALFFMVFPQLIRNLKPQNKNKVLMDQLYASRLRTLPVNRLFIFHEYQRYSALIEITKSTVQEQLSFRLNEGQIDLQVYAKFLKEMSANYYVQKHEQIYWVSKQKMTHLYHMIQRCKTKDFLKMNWLLKVGLSNTSYNLLHKFYYSTKTQIEQANRFLRTLSLQQLSLLNAYLMLCLQSLLDIQSFEQSKKNPKPHYLSSIILQIPQPKRLPIRQLEQLRALEGHSDAIVKKAYERRGKGIYINQNDCPSLLAPVGCNEVFTKSKQQRPQIMLGKGNLPTPWNEDKAKLKKQPTQERTKNEQQFPTLWFGQIKGSTSKQVKEQTKNIKQVQQDFPIFNFKQKYITHKLPVNQEPTKEVNNWINFNNKSINRSHWDEDQTRKKWKDTQTQKKEEKKFQNNNGMKTAQMDKSSTNSPGNKKRNNAKQNTNDDQEDKYLRMAIEESLHTAQQEGLRRKEETIKKQQQTYQIIVPKKNNKIQEQESPKTKKKKRGGQKKQQQQPAVVNKEKQQKSQLSLFERVQLQQKEVQNRKRSPFRRDKSYQKNQKSEIQKSLSSIVAKNDKKILSNAKGPIFDDDDFVPLGQTTSVTKQSIITRIIKQNQSKQEIEEVRPQKQRHKKKKNRGQQYD